MCNFWKFWFQRIYIKFWSLKAACLDSINHHLTVCTSCTFEWGWCTMKPHFLSDEPSVSKDVCWNSFAHRQILSSCASLYIEWHTHCLEVLLCFMFCFHSRPSAAFSQLISVMSAFDIVIKAQWGEWTAAHLGIAPFCILNVMLLFVSVSSITSCYCPVSCTTDLWNCCILYSWLKWQYTGLQRLLHYKFLYWFITAFIIEPHNVWRLLLVDVFKASCSVA